MKTKLIETLKKGNYKDRNQDTFDSNDFLDFIENSTKTINFYKDTLTDFLADKLYDIKKEKFNYECIGKVFVALSLFVKDTKYDIKEILKTTKELELYEELKHIYFNSMLQPYQNSLNGAKGGAPKGNANAKKTTAATCDNIQKYLEDQIKSRKNKI